MTEEDKNKEHAKLSGFNPKEEDSFAVDKREIYLRGFNTLSDEDKNKVLTGFLLTQGLDETSPLTINDKIKIVESEHAIWKEREFHKHKKIYTYIGFFILIVVLVFTGIEIKDAKILSDKDTASVFLNLIGKIAELVYGQLPPPPEV